MNRPEPEDVVWSRTPMATPLRAVCRICRKRIEPGTDLVARAGVLMHGSCAKRRDELNPASQRLVA
jgi:hypothetical protein